MLDIICVCPMCGAETIVSVPENAYVAWQEGELIQHAMPMLSESARECLISGFCSYCQEDLYDEDDLEEEYYEDYDLEMGFNPYEGCYDYDC